ncbi:hypothetical protein DL98DRAFT_652134 [Cadophora sp. DSE1049]|nr:hypothetical protein DL98DRAFT_652134 [Cadophora sp. DSE1049]
MGLISFIQRLFSSPQERPDEREPEPIPEPAAPEPAPEPVPEPEPEPAFHPTEDTPRARTSRSSPSATRARRREARDNRPRESWSGSSPRPKYVYEWLWACCHCGGHAAVRVPRVMDISRSAHGQFKQNAFAWSSIFSQRRHDVYGSEDLRYVDSLRMGTLPHDRELTTEEVIGWFVHNQCNHDVDRYFYREGHLSEFLGLASLDSLSNPASPMSTFHTALMDDRNDETVTRNILNGNARPSSGPMTARRLYLELLKPRTNFAPEVNAERRLIYITDLDPSYALSLAATASRFQASYLRDFMYKYLTSRTSIGIQTRTAGFSGFALEFHLPYYARRRMLPIQNGHTDPRLRNGKSLRRSEEVIHLSLDHQHTTAERDYIHEAQVSIMVIGVDDWFWTAYCFADVYFKSEEHTEQVGVMHRNNADPHSCGKYFLDRPVWNPRHYFLRSLSCRMEQVKQEWNNTIFQLFEDIEPCIYAFTRGELGQGESIDLDITQRKGFRWTIRVLRQFTHVLSKTIDSWDTFKDGEIRYLNLPDSESLADASWGNLLAAIDKDVIELRDLRSSLQHKTELFENMTNSIVTHAAHAETIITRLQSQFIQALTVITIFYLPPTLASSIFSMQDSIFTDPKFRDWLFTLLGLFMATALLVLAVLAFNNPRISTWVARLWASVIRFPARVPRAFRNIKRALFGGAHPDPDPDEIEMDEQDDQDAPGAGEV